MEIRCVAARRLRLEQSCACRLCRKWHGSSAGVPARKRLASTPDSEFAKNWSLADRGQVLLTTTKLDVVRTWVINHTIHHRAFLCSYLRLNDIPVPGLYGPSGDEG